MFKTHSWRLNAAVIVLAVGIGIAGCSSDADTTSGSIAISVSPASATIQQGASTIVTGTLTRTDFTGSVTVTVEGAPTGASGSASISGNTATITVTTASTTPTGVYALTIRAKGSGLATDATATFSLTVAAATASSYTLTLGSPTLSVVQGAPGNSTITIDRTSFTDNIALSVDNLPTGVTAAFVPNPAPAGTSALTLTVGSTVATGTYNLVVRGTAAGLTDVTAPLALTITAAAGGGFTILATPAALSVAQGATNTTGGVKATRTGGFSGAITYSLTGVPAGVTAAFATTGVADSMQVSVSATGAVTPGTYQGVIHGVSGAIDHTTPLSITVTGAGGSGVRLDYSACVPGAKPAWIAYQDGTGAWTRVTGVADVYTFNINSPKGALAVVTPSDAGFSTIVYYFSQAEFVANTGGCAAAVTSKTVNGSVTGLAANDAARMSLAGSTAFVPANGTFSLSTVLDGTFDLVGYRRNSVTPGVGDRGLLRRDQNIAANGTLAVADFTGGESFAAATANLTVTGAGAGDQIFNSMSYLTGAACTSASLYSGTSTTATTFPMFGIPTASQRATDFHSLLLTDVGTGTSSRTVIVNFHTMADRTVAFGAAITPTVTNVTGALAYKRLQAALTLSTDYPSASFSYVDTPGNQVSIIQSAGYLAGNSAVTLALPDFTGAAGLTTTWFPAAAAAVNYAFSAINFPLAACVEGATTKFASVTGAM
jgi:hypothetical protein